MAKDVLDRAIERAGWTEVDASSVDQFLAQGGKSVLFFTGDSSKRPEADDVAVILPEIQKDFNNGFRVGVVRREAYADLKDRFSVHFLPTLCLMTDDQPSGNIVRIQNWSQYSEAFQSFMSDAKNTAGAPLNVWSWTWQSARR